MRTENRNVTQWILFVLYEHIHIVAQFSKVAKFDILLISVLFSTSLYSLLRKWTCSINTFTFTHMTLASTQFELFFSFIEEHVSSKFLPATNWWIYMFVSSSAETSWRTLTKWSFWLFPCCWQLQPEAHPHPHHRHPTESAHRWKQWKRSEGKKKKRKNSQVGKVSLPVFCHVHLEVPETFFCLCWWGWGVGFNFLPLPLATVRPF